MICTCMKKCIICKNSLPASSFYKKRNDCRACCRKRTKTWETKNPEKSKAVHTRCCARYYRQLTDLRNNILSSNPCIVCQEKRVGCLDFHHVDPSTKEICIRSCHSLKKIMREVVKCTVLCANCHRLYHLGQVTLPTIKPLNLTALEDYCLTSHDELEQGHNPKHHHRRL